MTNLGAAIVLLALGPDSASTKVAYATQEVNPSSTPTNLTKAPTTIADGRFARYLEAPDGSVDGIVLEDGTVARFAPRTKEVFDSTTFRRGDPIRVSGDLVLGLPLPYLVHASVSRGTIDTSTTERHPPSSGSKAKQADDTLVGESHRLAHKRTRLKATAHEIRRLTTGSGSRPLDPQWSRRREDDGP
jgi:hypothetical protein